MLVREQVQKGLPEGLYTVKMYAFVCFSGPNDLFDFCEMRHLQVRIAMTHSPRNDATQIPLFPDTASSLRTARNLNNEGNDVKYKTRQSNDGLCYYDIRGTSRYCKGYRMSDNQ